MTIEPKCTNCKHWRGGFICDAYPRGIPLPIQWGEVSHLEPFKDDNGIQYEPNEQLIRQMEEAAAQN